MSQIVMILSIRLSWSRKFLYASGTREDFVRNMMSGCHDFLLNFQIITVQVWVTELTQPEGWETPYPHQCASPPSCPGDSIWLRSSSLEHLLRHRVSWHWEICHARTPDFPPVSWFNVKNTSVHHKE